MKFQLPGGRPISYLHSAAGEFNLGWLRTNPMNGRVEELNPGWPDYKSWAPLNHSATQPPGSLFEFTWQFLEKNVLVYLQALHHQLKTSFLNKQRTSARCLICKCQKELFFYLDSSWKEPYSWFAELGKGSLYCILGKGTEL